MRGKMKPAEVRDLPGRTRRGRGLSGLPGACLIAVAALAAGFLSAGPAATENPEAVPKETVDEFLARANAAFDESDLEHGAAVWTNVTYLTDETSLLVARASARDGELRLRMAEQAGRFRGAELSPGQRRDLSLINRAEYMPERMALPKDPDLREEMTITQRRLVSEYGSGRYCPSGQDSCKGLGELSAVIMSSRDPETLLDAWQGWRTVSDAMREDYRRFVELSRLGAGDFGYADLGEMWRDAYDMGPSELSRETERLWEQVRPLYRSLHCYARNRLADFYGEELVSRDGPIPAHLLGNMWAQRWDGIFDLLEPYPGTIDLDVTAALEARQYDSIRIARTAERFFMSLGLPALPESFWEKSMLSRPRDRVVLCQPTSWNINPAENDVRISQCIVPTEKQFVEIHHELGHIYYFLAYNHLSNIHRGGANSAFHEGIGDSVNLSLTPGYYQSLGLIEKVPDSREATINGLLKLALHRIAFLPFALTVDQWRWGVFSGEIPADRYNQAWWELRVRQQGVAAPTVRGEDNFDAGSKYHIPANMPYARYFLARILQFQLHRAMCERSGWQGPLHECSIFGSEAAGELLWEIMRYGASQPWQDTLEAAIGTREFDASAMLEYFSPLSGWLDSENQDRQCGW